MGLPDFIIQSASNYLTEENIRFEDVISNLEHSRQAAEEERTEANRFKLEIEKLKIELEREKAKLSETKQKLNANAQREARRIIEDAKRQADELVQEIRNSQKAQEQKEVNRTINEVKRKLNEKLKETDSYVQIRKNKDKGSVPKDLIAGNSVYLIDIEQSGTLISAPKPDGTVTVQVGIMKINSHISNLQLVNEEKKKNTSVSKSTGGRLRSFQMKNEIDIR